VKAIVSFVDYMQAKVYFGIWENYHTFLVKSKTGTM